MPRFYPNNQGATMSASVSFSRADGFRLRRVDPNTNEYAPAAPYSASGTVTWAAMPMTALKAFWGLAVNADVPTGTDVRLQVSTDGGTTWKWWNGAAWAVTAGVDAASITDTATNIASLAVGSRNPRVRAYLSTTDTDLSPRVGGVCLLVELLQEPQRDAEDSLCAFLESDFRPRINVKQILAAGPPTYATMTIETPFTVTAVDSAWNNATGASVLASSSGAVVTFTAPHAAGVQVNSLVRASCDARVGFADDELTKAKTPLIGINIASATPENESQGLNAYDWNEATGRVRIRRGRKLWRVTANIYAMGPRHADAVAMMDELDRLFGFRGAWFPFLATNEAARLVDYEPYRDVMNVNRGLHAVRADLEFLAPRYDEAYEDLPQLQRVLVWAGGLRYEMSVGE